MATDMPAFRFKAVIKAITFDQLVQHGLEVCRAEGRESNIVNGMPWSFSFQGVPFTHETNDCYLLPVPEGTGRFERGDMLITDESGNVFPCKGATFAKTYEAVGEAMSAGHPPQVTAEQVEGAIASEHYGTAADLGDLGLIKAGSAKYPEQLQRVTLCTLVLKNGFTITGTNHAASAPNFDAERGREEARADAIRQLWAFMVFALRDRVARGCPA